MYIDPKGPSIEIRVVNPSAVIAGFQFTVDVPFVSFEAGVTKQYGLSISSSAEKDKVFIVIALGRAGRCLPTIVCG